MSEGIAHDSTTDRARREGPEETPLWFELSLCLSRACLGKMMHLVKKWHRKSGVSFYRERVECVNKRRWRLAGDRGASQAEDVHAHEAVHL